MIDGSQKSTNRSVAMFKNVLRVIRNSILRLGEQSNAQTSKYEHHHNILKTSMKELSEGASVVSSKPDGTGVNLLSKPLTLPTIDVIKQWDKLEIKKLSIEQIEELALAYYTGRIDNSSNDVGHITNSIINNKNQPSDSLNAKRAVTLWNEGYKRGSIESTFALASCYREGFGVERSVRRAYDLYLYLADTKNDPISHYTLGQLLSDNKHENDGIKQDDEASFRHFKVAAKGGVLTALHNMGNCYADGKGVKQSDHNAKVVYDSAAQAGDPSSKFILGTWLYTGRGGVVDKKKSFELQLEAAELGHPMAMFNVASNYMSGELVDQDMKKAVHWYDQASKKGVMQARHNLGKLYYEGLHIPKDLQKALTIFNEGMKLGDEISKEFHSIIEEELKK